MVQDDARQAGLLHWLATHIHPQSGIPIYLQLKHAIERAVTQGQLRPGDPLPTVRAVASALHLAPNTVSRAYAALQRDGLTYNRAGAGTVLTEQAAQPASPQALDDLRALLQLLLHTGTSPADIQAVVTSILADQARRTGEA